MQDKPLNDFPLLSFAIAEPANALYAGWLLRVGEKAPHRLFRDKSNQYIPVDALCRALLNAWHTISEKEPGKRNNEGWSTGFLMGYVQSVLSVSWSSELLEPGLAYRNAFWLQAMILYVDAYGEARTNINRLYQAMLNNNDPTTAPSWQDGDAAKAQALVVDSQSDANWYLNKTYLETHFVNDVKVAVEKQETIDVPDLVTCFTEDQLVELINVNPYL